MKKRKGLQKVIAGLMVMILAISMLGCGSSDTVKEDTVDTTVSSDEKEEEATTRDSDTVNTETDSGVVAANTEVSAEDILSRDFSEKITISYAGVQVVDGLDYNQGNEYYSWWTDTFNVEWDVTALTWANWAERLNIWINADDMPDWCVWNFNAGDAMNYADQELVKRMPDDWKEKYPNLAAATTCADANAYYENLYDGMYYFFRPVFANNFPADTITQHVSVYLRTDWAEQVGFDLTANKESGTITLTELLEYCQTVKDAGLTEYPWYNTSAYVTAALDMATEAAGVYQSAYYKGSDGKYHWGPAEEETGIKETLRQIKGAYDAGLIYPEFYALSDPNDLGYFQTSGDSAVCVYGGMAANYDRISAEMNKSLGINYWDNCDVFVLTDDAGVAHGDPSVNYFACNIISPNIDDATLERLLTIWDYSCTEEAQLQIRLGMPEVDWTYDENGEIVTLLEEQGYSSLEEKYTDLRPVIANMFILSDDYSFINPGFTKEARQKVSDMYITRAGVTSIRGMEPDWDYLGYSSQTLNLATLKYTDEYVNLITKPGDFDENYDTWVKEKMLIIQPALDELNEVFGN